jgi:hypothetical protein
LEKKKIDTCLERHEKRSIGQVGFRGNHSTVDHLVMFRIIAEEVFNDKTNLLCCFIDFRKYFDIVSSLYEKVTTKFSNTKDLLEEINCNIGVKQGCPLYPTIFNIYIDNLEDVLEDVYCVDPTLTSVVIILFLCVGDIILMVESPYDLAEKPIILKEFLSRMGMILNIEKKKVMIFKSKRITYNTLVYDKNSLEEVPPYKYLGIDIHHKFSWNYSTEKRINKGVESLLWSRKQV